MTLLELNEIIEGKYKEELKNPTTKRIATTEEIEAFRKLLSINPAYANALNTTDSAVTYYKAFPLLNEVVDEDIKEDLFYAVKLGYSYKNVPSKLTYLLKKALSKYPSPNLAISAINKLAWGNYLKKGSLPEGITIKMVIDNLVGSEVSLLSSYQRKVKYKDFYELYVPGDAGKDRVCLIPENIAEELVSIDDLQNINYDPAVGVCVYDKPLRIFNERIGLVENDFDLREAK